MPDANMACLVDGPHGCAVKPGMHTTMLDRAKATVADLNMTCSMVTHPCC